MPVVIYKVTRTGGTGVRFQGKDGTDFADPRGLDNPQIGRIVGKRLLAYLRCEVGRGFAEVLGEASAEEIATYENHPESGQRAAAEGQPEAAEGRDPFRFPGV